MSGPAPLADAPVLAAGDARAVRIVRPQRPRGGLVCSSPHSGRHYPDDLLRASRLDPITLRRSEDAFVDELLAGAPGNGAFLVTSDFARAYVDLNRDACELDPELIDDVPVPAVLSPRVQAGLGVIPRSVGDGTMIYAGRMSADTARQRLERVHAPYHDALETVLAEAEAMFGHAVLLDCHSMPAAAAGQPVADIVLGDRFGAACAPALASAAQTAFRAAGLKVARNNPYAGGYATERHGRPGQRRHALQIEINRSVYMVEGALTRRAGFAAVRAVLDTVIAAVAEASASLRQL